MRKLSQSIFIITLLLFGLPTAAQEQGNFELFQKVRHEENLALAPTALIDALSLLYFGSSGETEVSLKSYLFTEMNRHEAAKHAQQKQRTLPGYRSIGSLWFSNRLVLNDEFLKSAKTNWEYHTERIPIRADKQKAFSRINKWYSEQTHGSINSVGSLSDLDAPSDMLGFIVTAFASPWDKNHFKARLTSNEPFHRSTSEQFDVSMMKAVDSFQYYENEILQGLKISYANKTTSLLLLLPKNAKNFSSIKSQISSDIYNEFLTSMTQTRVRLWLPKVNYTSKITWHEVFKQSPIACAFTPQEAEFRHINNNSPEPLFISSLTQEVMVRWDERGTEARSTTSFAADPFGPSPNPEPSHQPISFIANHPFFYFIVNSSNKNVLFSGIIDSQEQMLSH